MKTVSILGSTGYIGRQALDIIKNSNDIKVAAVTAGRNIKLLEEQIRLFKPKLAVVADQHDYNKLKCAIADTATIPKAGEQALCEAAALEEVDTVIAAIVGIAALPPIVSAVKSGKTIGLANKEAMVAAGELINRLAQDNGSKIIPVDSEHSAIYQCLMCGGADEVKKIILTASGGPFFKMTLKEMAGVDKNRALAHPNWSMGEKITIDSATMMNKGLEVIEAVNLFGIPCERIEILVHRQSIIHSMVEFMDNSIIAQMGPPDMRIPIGYALNYPKRAQTGAPPCVFPRELTLEPPDTENFPTITYAYEAVKRGGSYPVALNAANEAAVGLFLEGRIGFVDIFKVLHNLMADHKYVKIEDLDTILQVSDNVYKDVLNKWR